MNNNTLQPCMGMIGLFFGHKIRPRYHETREYPVHAKLKVSGHGAAELVKAMADLQLTYVHDVCERCGYVIKESILEE